LNKTQGSCVIADNLTKAGWNLGWVSAVDRDGRTVWIADAHRDGKRFVVRANGKLTAFLELESAISAHAKEAWRAKKSWLRIAPSQLGGFNNPTST
jgi:hypothetical protein